MDFPPTSHGIPKSEMKFIVSDSVRVYLDGKLQSYVTKLDTKLGTLTRLVPETKPDERGLMGFHTEEVHGVIRVVYDEAWQRKGPPTSDLEPE